MKNIMYFVALLLLVSVANAADERYERYYHTPFSRASLYNVQWVVDLEFSNGGGKSEWLIMESGGNLGVGAKSAATKLLLRKRVKYYDTFKVECSYKPLIDTVYNSGDVRYFLWDLYDSPDCIPGALFVTLSMLDKKSFLVSAQGANGNIVAEGIAKPDYNSEKAELLPLTESEIEHNSKLFKNKDSYIGSWTGEINGKKIEFYNWYKYLVGQERIAGIGSGFMIEESGNCLLELKTGFGQYGPSQRELELMNWDADVYDYLNSQHIGFDEGKHNPCSEQSPVYSWKSKDVAGVMDLKSPNTATLTLYKWIFNDSRTLLENFEKIGEGEFQRSVISKKMRETVIKQWPKAEASFSTPRAAVFHDPTINFSEIWRKEYVNLLCSENPFCYISGGQFISAIYDGDVQKQREIERGAKITPEGSLIKRFATDYLYNYKNYFGSCLSSGSYEKVTKRNITQVNQYGGEISDVNIEFTYRVKPDMKSVCDQVCNYRGARDIFTLGAGRNLYLGDGAALDRQVASGVIELMKKHRCDSPEILKLEKNMKEIISQN